ncbi:polysaccharide deacetylase family protein (plasmid) [Roseobacteraceae bacterium NS-SX3]
MSRAIGLNFHGIGVPQRELEPGEAPFWLSEAEFAAVLDRVAAAPDPQRYVLTFDDGNLSDHEIALPALLERGLRARFFVLTGRLGTPGALTAAQVQELQAAGMRIGSHGIAHRAWPGLEDAALAQELTRSRAELEEILGREVREAGIPFGRYDARVLRALRRAGYGAAYSSDGGPMRRDAFLRPRSSLRGGMDAAALDALLAGQLAPLRRLRRAAGMAKRRLWPAG